MKSLLTGIAACCMLIATSCDETGQKDQSVTVQEMQMMSITEDTTILPMPPEYQEEEIIKGNVQSGTPVRHIEWDKKIIKTGTLRMEVENYQQYNKIIHELVSKWEAYIANEQEDKSEYKIENTLTIRIPVQYFDEAVQQLNGNHGKLLYKQIAAQEVTDEYLDTRARMEAKKRIRLRYLDMLKQAKNMGEILQVEREVNAIQEQIEAGEGRVKYLGHAAAYSTINLTFFQVLNAAAAEEQPTFGDRSLLAFSKGAKMLGELLLFAIQLWPFWLALALTVWILGRLFGRRSVQATTAIDRQK